VPLAQAQYGRRHDERAYSQQSPQQPYPGRPDRQRERGRNDGDRRSLTPDEQRDLRRDLQRANKEIYRKGKDRKNQQ
jgi:hypothetical protein